ncbi:hypothetical protein HNS38_15890 [Lentimicrobium sp. L6]|uniref:hypothetical protein n=1 Tax=Lentimicrobium sp. L6 TaxID=2735916 RepID=UPI001556C715|nr:hypothetical protein [Lentimicrobium sp. L6]NPD86255.1 hypothetical protein [Lentimicrobium sp. L6]
MKKIILLMVISMAILSVTAQEKVKQKELGLVFRNFNNFGLMYKFGDQNSMWRLKSVYIRTMKDDIKQVLYNQDQYQNEIIHKGTSLGLSFGKQYTAPIDERISFIYGADIEASYGYYYKQQEYDQSDLYTTERKIFGFGLNCILGFNYLIGESFVFGFELLPGASYSIGKRLEESNQESFNHKEYDLSYFQIGLSSSSALLNFAYRF